MADQAPPEIGPTQDLVQESDNKARTRVTVAPASPKRIAPAIVRDEYMATQLFARLNAPAPSQACITFNINVLDMHPYFGSSYDSIVNALYPDDNNPATILSRDNYICVLNYITRSRIAYVLEQQGLYFDAFQRLAYQTGTLLPASVAAVIQGLGRTHIYNGFQPVTPGWLGSPSFNEAEENRLAAEGTQAERIGIYEELTHDRPLFQHEVSANLLPAQFTAFHRFMDTVQLKNAATTAYLTETIEGTPWYTIGAMTAFNNPAQGNANEVYALAPTNDANPADIIMALLVQRRHDGTIPGDCNSGKWRSRFLSGCTSHRRVFNLSY